MITAILKYIDFGHLDTILLAKFPNILGHFEAPSILPLCIDNALSMGECEVNSFLLFVLRYSIPEKRAARIILFIIRPNND